MVRVEAAGARTSAVALASAVSAREHDRPTKRAVSHDNPAEKLSTKRTAATATTSHKMK